MNIEEIIKAWKSAEDAPGTGILESPVGQEITEHDLREVVGGMDCSILSCGGVVSCFLINSAPYTTTSY